jgi:hypothetical protein
MAIFKTKSPLAAGTNSEDDDKDFLADEEDKKEDAEEEEEGMNYDEDDEEADAENKDSIVIGRNKLVVIKKLLENIRDNNEKLIGLLGGFVSADDEVRIGSAEAVEGMENQIEESANVVEGVFDGENMIGPDGKQYSVPANYASKSKLVEGDMLKLTITGRGAFVYKQTKPVERKRVIGQINKDDDGNFVVLGDQRKWRVLTASITYFKGTAGDKAVILIPVSGDSQWAAVENIIRNK